MENLQKFVEVEFIKKSTPEEINDMFRTLKGKIDKLEGAVQQAKNLCQKFVDKVETGRAISKETYADCKEFLSRN